MPREYFCAYHSYIEAMEALTDAEKGRLFTACLSYSKTGEAPQLSGNERFLFPAFRSQIDRDNAGYAQRCKTNRENRMAAGGSDLDRLDANGYDRGRTTTNVYERGRSCTNVDERGRSLTIVDETHQGEGEGKGKGEGNTPDGVKGARAKFTPPTLEEVRAYIAQRGSPVDPEEFVDFYASKGWKVGREPMRDWKAACRNAERWEKYRDRKAGASRSAPDEYSLAAVRQLMSEEVD